MQRDERDRQRRRLFEAHAIRHRVDASPVADGVFGITAAAGTHDTLARRVSLDLVAGPRAGLAQGRVQLLLARRAADDAEAAVGAEDAERAPRIGLGPVDEELGEAVRPFLGGRRRRAELEQAAPEALDAFARRA